MSYLSNLRQFVGHQPLLMVGATVFVLDERDRLLLLKRVDNESWGPPGGAVEPGEVVEEAVVRETLEETGLELQDTTLYSVFSGEDQFYRYPNGDEVHIVDILYICRHFTGEVRLSGEHTAWGWFELDRIPQPISPPIIPILKKFLADTQNRNP